MALEAFHWRAPAFVLLGLPLCHSEVASKPLAFTERVRDDTSLPLPLFLRRSRLLLPLSEGLRNLLPDFVPMWTVVKPVLLSAFLHLDIRPANIEQSLLRPTSFQQNFSGHVTMLFGPIAFHFLSQESSTFRGGKIRPLHQVDDTGKRVWKSSELQWSSSERKVMGVVEDYLEKCEIEALERFMESEDEEVSLRYILTYSTRGGSNISSSLTQHRKRTTSWQAKGVG